MSVGKSMRKAATNVSLPRPLVGRARHWKINLSELLERALETELKQREAQAWLAESEAAIELYNRRVEAHGVFSDDWRKF
jgi:antitoxin CcdA